jgi:hypothetical protein
VEGWVVGRDRIAFGVWGGWRVGIGALLV